MLRQYIFRFQGVIQPRLLIRHFGGVNTLVAVIGNPQDKLFLFWILLTTLGREFLGYITPNLMMIGHIVKQKVTLYFGTIKQIQVINIIVKTQLIIGLLFNKKLSTNMQFHYCLADSKLYNNLYCHQYTILNLKNHQTTKLYQKLYMLLLMLIVLHLSNNQVQHHQKHLLLFVFYKGGQNLSYHCMLPKLMMEEY